MSDLGPSTGEVVSLDVLLQRRIPEDFYEIEGVGVVKIRALSRAEALQIEEAKTTTDRDRKLIAWGVVEPQISYQHAKLMQEQTAVGELEGLTVAIATLSGMVEGSQKETTKSDPG